MMSRNSSESNNSWLSLAGGFEPPTHCLQGSCSSPELRQPCRAIRLARHPDRVGGAHRGLGRSTREPDLMMLRNDHAMDPEGVGGPKHGTEIPRVLDLVQRQKERGLIPPRWDVEEVVQLRVLGGGDAGDHTLMVGRPGDGGELVACAI